MLNKNILLKLILPISLIYLFIFSNVPTPDKLLFLVSFIFLLCRNALETSRMFLENHSPHPDPFVFTGYLELAMVTSGEQCSS